MRRIHRQKTEIKYILTCEQNNHGCAHEAAGECWAQALSLSPQNHGQTVSAPLSFELLHVQRDSQCSQPGVMEGLSAEIIRTLVILTLQCSRIQARG